MYIYLKSERAKKLGEELVRVVNSHNYNPNNYWYCNGEKIFYKDCRTGDIIGGKNGIDALHWFAIDFQCDPNLIEGEDWEIVCDKGKRNTLDVKIGEHFVHEGKEYVVTELESIGCIAEPVDKIGWDGIGLIFSCLIVEVV